MQNLWVDAETIILILVPSNPLSVCTSHVQCRSFSVFLLFILLFQIVITLPPPPPPPKKKWKNEKVITRCNECIPRILGPRGVGRGGLIKGPSLALENNSNSYCSLNLPFTEAAERSSGRRQRHWWRKPEGEYSYICEPRLSRDWFLEWVSQRQNWTALRKSENNK